MILLWKNFSPPYSSSSTENTTSQKFYSWPLDPSHLYIHMNSKTPVETHLKTLFLQFIKKNNLQVIKPVILFFTT